MMDFSVEANGPTAPNTTLIHWILPALSSPNGTTALSSHQQAIAPYFPPGPPAGQTHTYALFLYEEPADFTVPPDFVPIFANLTASAFNRVGFNLTKFVDETHLGNPIAADWFLVSNTSATSTSSGTSATSSSTAAIPSSSSSSGSVGLQVEMVFAMAIGAAELLFSIL
jgi:phosphatidylethanolamine-binding protein